MLHEDVPSVAVIPVEPDAPNLIVPVEGEYYSAPESYFDMGGGNSPSYGLQTVTIVGQRLPTYHDFDTQYVNFTEYTWLVGSSGSGGSGGGGGTSDGCGHGKQLINWGFIEALEGSSRNGDVPKDKAGHPLGTSGVTIASGFDLGAHDRHDLEVLGFSSQLINKLSPYLQLQGDKAVAYENAHALVITDADVKTINAASHAQTVASLAVKYDSAVGKNGAFFSLPGQAQTVIASVAFQNGDLARKAPAFWNDVVTKNWTAAVAELRNFHDIYGTRRNQEADFMEPGITAGLLVNGSLCAGSN